VKVLEVGLGAVIALAALTPWVLAGTALTMPLWDKPKQLGR
jgi:hypothetical protein